MSINVNKITSTLAKLGDTELQQYAQMHKNDPYIMALAMSESNRRKEIRDADQGAQGMQEQPKVVDQMVAEMAPQQLPEDMGIARIPAGEMNFAGGGIVAFADGGDVERYQVGGSTYETPYDRMNRLNREAAAAYRLSGDSMGGFTPDFAQSELMSSASALAATDTERAQRAKTLAELEQKVAFLTSTGAPQAAAARAQLEAFKASGQPMVPAAAPATPVATPATDSAMDRRLATGSQPSIASFRTPLPSKAGDAAAKTGAGRKETAPKAATEPSAKPDTGGLDSLIQDVTRKTDLAQGDLRNQRAGLAAQYVQSAEQEREEGEKRRKARGDVFAGREARLAEREKGVAKMKDQNFGLALLQAGAAMMSTPGNLGTAIGKGVQVGSERYIAGIDKINAAKEKFAEARDRLDDLRINRDDMNEKEIRDENRAIRNARLQGQQLFLDGATNDLKISNDNMRTFFTAGAESILTDRRIQGQKEVARITSAPALERNALLKLSQSNDNKVRTEYGKLQAKVMETLNKDDNYKMAKPAEQQVMQNNALRQALMNNPFLSSYAAGIGFSSAPTGGKVYDLTGD